MRTSRHPTARWLDRRTFLAGSTALLFAHAVEAAVPAGPGRAQLYVYTRPRVRARHADIVRAALARRAAAHTSGWRRRADRPQLEIGPVRTDACHWKGDKLIKPITRAWPFAAVLEYDGDGKPEAYIDWFRRAHDSAASDGWLLDPNLDYAEHLNAEMVFGQNPDASLMAVVDTPTGSYVGGHDLVIRARVRWADGTQVQKGWWLWFEAADDKGEGDWRAVQVPLVDWRVTRTTDALGIVETARVVDPARELAVLGTSTVFRFPVMPAGLNPGRGRA